ncbi:MAG TPA: hypothetical protein DCS97_06745 [Planctomycetes bacterium]|nr:hypothetical protein [Planctomycetota bacterium]
MPRSHKYKSAWGTFVQYLLDDRGISHGELSERLGTLQGTVSHYISGRSKPPLGDLDRWAAALRCTHDDAERLSWLALEPWTPEPVWRKIKDLEAILADQESVVSGLAEQVAKLRAELGRSGAEPLSPGDQ